MTPSDPHRLPDDLQDVAELLRGNRPEATALELDGVKRQVRSRVSRAASGRTQKGSTMKSKFAMMAMLVVGLLMSGTGAGLAVSGLSSSGDASIAQYPDTPTIAVNQDDLPDAGDVLPNNEEGGNDDEGGVQGETDESNPEANPDVGALPDDEGPNGDVAGENREAGAQATRQVEANGADELPFTGFAAVPILIGGIALMGGGLVLRRRTAE